MKSTVTSKGQTTIPKPFVNGCIWIRARRSIGMLKRMVKR